MSRKEASFRQLVEYMERGTAEVAFSHNLCSNPYGRRDDIIAEFERNAEYLRARKNGNALYHEVISLEAGGEMGRDAAAEALAEIGREYLYRRAPHQMALGMVHSDGPYLHLHICMSANAVGKSKRERLSRKEFSEVQKVVEDLALVRWNGLGQRRIYNQAKERSADRLKATNAEQEMHRRRGARSRKEDVKARLHTAFERAASPDELVALLREGGLDLYQRGKSTGIMDRETGRRHRLSSLGVEPHYAATVGRLMGQWGSKSRAAEPLKPHSPGVERGESLMPERDATESARAGEKERAASREPEVSRQDPREQYSEPHPHPSATVEWGPGETEIERRMKELLGIVRDRDGPERER